MPRKMSYKQLVSEATDFSLNDTVADDIDKVEREEELTQQVGIVGDNS